MLHQVSHNVKSKTDLDQFVLISIGPRLAGSGSVMSQHGKL